MQGRRKMLRLPMPPVSENRGGRWLSLGFVPFPYLYLVGYLSDAKIYRDLRPGRINFTD